MILKNKKAMTPMLAVVVLLIITVSVSGGAFFWLNKIQGQIEGDQNSEVRGLGAVGKIDVIASEYDANQNQLTLFLQNLDPEAIPISSSAAASATVWVVKNTKQEILCSTDWSGNDNGPKCTEGCNKDINTGEVMKVVLSNVGQNSLCNIGAQPSGTLLTLTIDFGGKAVATGGIVR